MDEQPTRAQEIRDVPIKDRLPILAEIYNADVVGQVVDHEIIAVPETFTKAYVNLEVTVPQSDGTNIHGVIKTPNKKGYEGRLLKTVTVGERWLTAPQNQWPEGLSEAFGIPEILRYDGSTETLLEQFVDARSVGTNHAVEKNMLTVTDIHDIADAARFIQKIGNDLIRTSKALEKFFHFRVSVPWVKAPDANGKWQDKYHVDFYNNDARVTRLREFLGDEVVNNMGSQLDSETTSYLFRDSAPRYFVWGNFIAGKMSKDANGKKWLFERERCTHSPNPASDMVAFFTTLWPEQGENGEQGLQEKYFRYSVVLNKDIPDYLEYARLDFIFNRGSGELNYYLEEIEKLKEKGVDEKDAYFQECVTARDTLGTLLKAAVIKDGIWDSAQYVSTEA